MKNGGALHFIPERLLAGDGETRCCWIDLGDARYSEPFFELTVAKRRWALAATETSSLREVCERAAAASAPDPTAFVFHVSRCGSTLVSQLLALDERAIVLSEPPILDEVLRSGLPQREQLFGAALRLLCRRRFGTEERAFLKTDSWHIFDAPDLRRLYPQTPFLLLYRFPEAVLASHRKARGRQMVPGLVGGAAARIEYDPQRHTLDGYAAAVLERMYRAMLQFASLDANSLLLSYDEGFPDVFFRMASWLGMSLDEPALRRIRERCVYHSKTPHHPFRDEAAAPITDIDLTSLRTLHERLEDLRQLHAGSRNAGSPARREAETALPHVKEHLGERAALASAAAAPQARRPPHGGARPADEVTARIVRFLQEVGLMVEEHEIPEATFLPGIAVREGVLQFDPARLKYPGDLLHEAGHLAVLPPAERSVSGSLGDNGGHEMAAIAWSFAACRHLGLPVELLFHADGYKGDAACLAQNFTEGRYVGVPLLEWRGMTRTRGERVYPSMIHWLCP